ncbi:sperm-associated antigen 8 [Spea bombifrons]|uniref:sperm-associated antigen 8 n=1 Tax=Spea bombifrons TaxID=233779 RepID=UPI00234BC914|nr:sperm-associated antigen 8 [Spea bombifrons]
MTDTEKTETAQTPDPPSSEPRTPKPPSSKPQTTKPPSPCLRHNWVEERAVASLEGACPESDAVGGAYVYKHGHSGILSTQMEAQIADSTTNLDSYKMPNTSRVREIGQREEMLKKFLYQKFSEEIMQPPTSPSEDRVTESTTKRDYRVEGFVPKLSAPSKSHDYRTEQPATFWSEHFHQIPGVSAVRTRDTPFKKNSAFTAPISEYLDQSLPCGLENYPNL